MMTRVYITDIGIFSEQIGLYEDCLRVLPKNRKIKAQSYHFEKDRYLSAAVYMLFLLGRYELLGTLRETELSYNEKGKPFLADESVYFSFSHSGTKAVCAFSDRNIGVDIEDTSRDVRPVYSVLCKNEKDVLSSLSGEKKNRTFIRYWTCKEACSKYTGLGLNERFSALDMSKITGEGSLGYEDRFMFSKDIDGHILSVCSHEAFPEIKKICFSEASDFISLFKKEENHV